MVIKEIELYKSKRLGFSEISRIHYTIDKLHQILLGRNGCGKSSLMAELSPLPASGNDYYKGGFKRIIIEHRGKLYELKNDFSQKSSGRHSFIVDNKEINDGGTGTVQKQLVLEHFGLDQELFDLLTGVTTFREMGPNQRRALLIRMADDNMEYALSVYNKTVKEQKNALSVYKWLDSQLVDEVAKFPEWEQKQKDLKVEHDYLNELHRNLTKLLQGQSNFQPEHHLQRSEQAALEVERIVNLINEMPYNDGGEAINPEELQLTNARLESEVRGIYEQITAYKNEFSDIKQTVEAISAQGAKDLDGLNKRRAQLLTEQQGFIQQAIIFPFVDFKQADMLDSVTDSIAEQFSVLTQALPDNSSGYFKREEYTNKKQHRQTISDKLDSMAPEQRKLEHLYYHLTKSEHVECPKCNTNFVPGMAKHDVNKVKRELNQVTDTMAGLDSQLVELDKYLGEVNDYLRAYRDLKIFMEGTPALAPLWNTLAEYKLTEYHPNKYLNLFEKWRDEITILTKALAIQKDVEAIDMAIERLSETSHSQTHYSQNSLDVLESKITNLSRRAQQIESEVANNTRLFQKHQLLQTHQTSLGEYQQQMQTHWDSYLNDSMKVFVEEVLGEINVQLGQVSIQLNEITLSRRAILDLTQKREDVQKRHELLSILVKHLNPTTGIIAEHSLKFISQFTNHMNDIINSIWSYDMQLLPLAISEDLTYKFPLFMADSETETPDINKASTAQKSIIDFAFKILLVTYLKLEDYPLWLDELPVGFDELHRIKLLEFVREYVEEGRCSQMFMISHNQEAHMTFPTAEVVMLDAANILNKPDDYNQNIVIDYG